MIHELRAMKVLVAVLLTLDNQARDRVLDYLVSRFHGKGGIGTDLEQRPMTHDPFTGHFMPPWGETDAPKQADHA